MTRPTNERLDAEERALAAALPRPHGRSAPGPELDARILAAARAAIEPPPAQRPRRSWIAPTALAASLVLAVGLAWQLRPPPSPEYPAQAADAASADPGSTAARAFEAPPAAPAMQAPPMPTPMTQARQSPATTGDALAKRASAPAAAADVAVAAAPAVAAPPPAPPAPTAAASAPAVAAMAQAADAAPAPVQAKARTGEPVRERAAASANAAAPARDQADNSAAGVVDSFSVDDPGEDVPPATADSPEVRDAWLHRIGELLAQGKTEDAKASLAEFRRRYPDAIVPPELRTLEP